MPDRYIPVSEDEQKFAAMIERVFSDQQFANAMRDYPARTLEQAGYKLNAEQKKNLETHLKRAQTLPNVSEEFIAFPLTRPVVNVITKGTRPAVRVITKGTQPVVQVAVNTILRVEESRLPELQAAPPARKKSEDTAE